MKIYFIFFLHEKKQLQKLYANLNFFSLKFIIYELIWIWLIIFGKLFFFPLQNRYYRGAMLLTKKRSQPENDFDYVDDFDPTQIFLWKIIAFHQLKFKQKVWLRKKKNNKIKISNKYSLFILLLYKSFELCMHFFDIHFFFFKFKF